MKLQAKTLFIFLLPLMVCAFPTKGKYKKEKNIHKTFTVNKNALLQIDNEYGDISITSWDKNETVVDVTIVSSGNDEKTVTKRLQDVDIQFLSSVNRVSATTKIKNQSSSIWSFFGISKRASVEIHYQIKVPVTNNVDIDNEYGAIHISRLEGSCTIKCEYGKLTIGELLSHRNKIEMEYASKSNIEYINNGVIDVDYSSLHIEKSEEIKITADYSHLSFGEITNLRYNCDYGSLKVQNAISIEGTSDYMQTSIENIAQKGIFKSDYGSIKIKNLKKGFEIIDIKTDYTTVKIESSTENSFSIKADLEFGHFKYADGYTFNVIKKDGFDKYYEGFYSSSNNNSKLIINSSYGSIKLY